MEGDAPARERKKNPTVPCQWCAAARLLPGTHGIPFRSGAMDTLAAMSWSPPGLNRDEAEGLPSDTTRASMDGQHGTALKTTDMKSMPSGPKGFEKSSNAQNKDVQRALARIGQGSLLEAEAIYKRLIKEGTRNHRVFGDLGAICIMQGRTQEGITFLKEAIAINPYHRDTLRNLGHALKEQGELDGAIVSYGKALSIKPNDPEALLNLGNALKEQGRLDAAIDSYGKALAIQPNHLEALGSLGAALHMQGDLEGALAAYGKVLSIQPNHPQALNDLGITLYKQGKPDAAVTAFKKALTVQPSYPGALNNLGNVLKEQGDLDGAIASYRKALSIEPNYPEALLSLGHTLREQGQPDAAIDSYRKALTIQPNYLEALESLGVALDVQGDPEGALTTYGKILSIEPNHPQALNNLGVILHKQEKLDAAITAFKKALAIQSSYPEALNNLGNVLQDQGDLEHAIISYKKALSIKPNYPKAMDNLGTALCTQGNLEGAITCYRKAIALSDADYVDAHVNLSLALLLSGDHEHGWEEYEWRFRQNRKEKFYHAHPQIEQWTGHNHSPGERLLIVSEQGLGDTLQFMRYLPCLDSSTMDVSFCAQPKLHGLIQSSGIIRNLLTPEEANATTTGKWLTLLSLARILKVSPDNPLVTRPYIKVAEENIVAWQEKLSNEKRPIIGINWHGNPQTEKAALQDRSLPLDAFAPVAKKTEATFLSLQKGFGAEQLTDCPFRHRFVACQEEINQTWDFVETAAMIMNCDLIITSDTAVAHVAGGLGKTTWLLLASVPDWRWGMAGERSTWYPSMRLFRQQQLGNWAGVMDRVVRALGASATIN